MQDKFLKFKKQYKKLMSFISKDFRGIPNDERKHLADIALWKSLVKYDNTKSSFPTFLHHMIIWEYLNYLKQEKFIKIRFHPQYNNSCLLFDLTSSLDTDETNLFNMRFLHNMKILEIATHLKLHKNTILKRLKTIKNKIKSDLTV